MSFAPPPPIAAWRHRQARAGFEVVFFRPAEPGWLIEGHAVAVEDEAAWAVDYEIAVDHDWRTRRAAVSSRTARTSSSTTMETDGTGHWRVNGAAAPELDGCLDVDLEASACTNTLPIRRLLLEVGKRADAPAAYVRACDGSVERLEQSYLRLPDHSTSTPFAHRFAYHAPTFDFSCELLYDVDGLVREYPGIAVRVEVD